MKYTDIFDVAQSAGVSTATVSRALNHPHKVKADTRKRVEKAISDTGYIRNMSAQAIHGKKTGTIGLIVPTLNNAIFASLIQAFSDALDRHAFAMLIVTHDYDLDREYTVLQTLLSHRVEGVALIGLDHREEVLHLLQKRSVPMITMWSFDQNTDMNCVGGDNFLAGQLITRHLLEKGARRFLTIFPDHADNDRAARRFMGVLSEINTWECDLPDANRLRAKYSVTAARTVMTDYILKNSTLPDAVIAGNDVIAQGILNSCLAAQINIPDTISVVGFGDFSSSSGLYPSLTTVKMNSRKVGQIAADTLIALIHKELNPPVKIATPVELAVRQSSV